MKKHGEEKMAQHSKCEVAVRLFYQQKIPVTGGITKIRQIRRDSKLIIEEGKSNKILDFRAHPDTPMLSDIVTASAK